MNPMADDKRIESLLSSYGLRTPVPAEYRRYILARKTHLYRRILKSAGRLTILTAVGASIYFLLKRIIAGITLTKIVLSVLITVSVSSGGYLAIRYIYLQYISNENMPVDLRADGVEKKLHSIVKPGGGKPAFEYLIAVRPFAGRSVEPAIRVKAAKHISRELTALRGGGFAGISHGGDSARYALVGSIETAGNSMTLLIKVVEVETSEIVFAAQEKLNSREELADVCVKISRRIAARIE